jgi:hypothetical protein
MENKIDIHRGFSGQRMRQVTCPECGHGGWSEYPCYCSKCHERDKSRVMMLPSSNGRIIANWCEVLRACSN